MTVRVNTVKSPGACRQLGSAAGTRGVGAPQLLALVHALKGARLLPEFLLQPLQNPGPPGQSNILEKEMLAGPVIGVHGGTDEEIILSLERTILKQSDTDN